MRSFHTRENRGFDTVKSTQKYVHSSSVRNVSSGLPCCQPYVLVCCDGEFGCDWDGDVSLHSSARVVALVDAFARMHRSFQVYVLQTFFTKTGRRYKV